MLFFVQSTGAQTTKEAAKEKLENVKKDAETQKQEAQKKIDDPKVIDKVTWRKMIDAQNERVKIAEREYAKTIKAAEGTIEEEREKLEFVKEGIKTTEKRAKDNY